MTSFLPRSAAPWRWFGSVTFVAFLAGCQSGEKPSGSVSGTVTYRGSPIAAGNVYFQSKENGVGAVAKIEGGRYTVEAPLAVGTYGVHLTESYPDPQPGVQTKAVPLKVPKKYLSAATSGLKYEVKEGSNDIGIDLTD